MNQQQPSLFSTKEINKALQYLFPISPDEPREIRVLMKSKKPVQAGWFTDPDKLIEALHQLELERPYVQGIYITLNPVPLNPGLEANKLGPAPSSTKDADVPRRKLFFLDLDPKRKSNTCATEQEKGFAYGVLQKIRPELEALGLKPYALVDSGSGYHLYFLADMPADDHTVPELLAVAARKHNTDHVSIDTKVGNPARITRLPGTCNQKGKNSPDRPWRTATLMQGFPDPTYATGANLGAVITYYKNGADPEPEKKPLHRLPDKIKPQDTDSGWDEQQLQAWIDHHLKGLPLIRKEPYQAKEGPATLWVFGRCPFNQAKQDDQHEDDKAFWLVQFSSGGIAAGCHHDRCTGLNWLNLRNLKEAGKPVITLDTFKADLDAWDADTEQDLDRQVALFMLQILRLNSPADDAAILALKKKHKALTLDSLRRLKKNLIRQFRKILHVDVRTPSSKEQLSAFLKTFQGRAFDSHESDEGFEITNINHEALAGFTAALFKVQNADEIRHGLIFDTGSGTFYRYSGDLWEPRSDADVERGLKAVAKDMVPNPKDIQVKVMNSKLFEQARKELNSILAYDLGVPRKGLIPLSNGVIDLMNPNPVILPYSPDHRFRNKLEWQYQPLQNEACPRFLELISLLDQHDQHTLQLFMGLFLIGVNYPQKILLLCGGAGTGKSTILYIITGLMRGQAVELSMEELGARFSYSRFIGKTLLIAPDQTPDFMNRHTANKLKALTGGAELSVEWKHRNERGVLQGQFNVVADMNGTPIFKVDADADAWLRRVIMLKFPEAYEVRRPEGWRAIPGLGEILLREEGQGIFNWALTGARMLLSNQEELGEMIPLADTQSERVHEAVTESDPVAVFLNEKVEHQPWGHEKEGTTTADLYAAFRNWQYSQGETYGLGRRRFYLSLKQLVPQIFTGAKYEGHLGDTRGKRGYVGIRLTPDDSQ